ncbi:MAG: GNAT family N-acetyltransferase [Bacteroides sp.]|nr:GNAT family N-acetyltransferase [Bacteroides sp.]
MLSIRKATTEDCILIHEMAHIAFTATYQNMLTAGQLEYMLEWMYSFPNIQKQMVEDGHVYFIAYYNQEPCGYVSVEKQDTDLFHLQKLYVLPAFQGKQIGKYLFNEVIRYVKEIHPEPCLIELNVNRNNKAVSFYERMGMKKVREGDFPIGNGYYMNDYIMGLDI